MFTDKQKQTLLKYYNEGMTSTNRQHIDLIEKCAKECQTTVDRIKVEIRTILMYFLQYVCMCTLIV